MPAETRDLDEIFVGAGLAPTTTQLYRRVILAAESWCNDRGTTLVDIDAATLAEYANGLTPLRRRHLRQALRSYWAAVGGEDRPLYAVRVPRKPRVIRTGTIDATFHKQVVLMSQRLREEGLSHKTVSVYTGTLRRAQAWCEERGWNLIDVAASDLALYCETAPKSWSGRKCLRSALGHFWRVNGRENPPLWLIRLGPRPRMICRALDPDQAAALSCRARERGGPEGLAVLLALYLALRREEIATLRWDDFSNGWLRVLGKGQKEASLPVHPIVEAALHALPPLDSVWLFPSRRSDRRPAGHVTPSTVWAWVRLVAIEAGVGPVGPHELRHTCLATANDATGDLRAVQEFARHSDPEVTAGYTRATVKRLNAVMMAIEYEPGRATPAATDSLRDAGPHLGDVQRMLGHRHLQACR